MDDETAGTMRAMIRRANLKNFKDDGETQTASVEVAEGIWRDDVEIHQPYGSASMAPEDGAVGIVVAIGGDEGDLAIMSVSNPSVRMGGLKEKEVGLFNSDGDKIVISPDGTINAKSDAKFTVTTKHATLDAPTTDLGPDGRTKAAGINHLVHVTYGSSEGMHPIATGSPSVNIKE